MIISHCVNSYVLRESEDKEGIDMLVEKIMAGDLALRLNMVLTLGNPSCFLPNFVFVY